MVILQLDSSHFLMNGLKIYTDSCNKEMKNLFFFFMEILDLCFVSFKGIA